MDETKMMVFTFGFMIETDYFQDGEAEITDDDISMFQYALRRIYGVNEDFTDEDWDEVERLQDEDIKEMTLLYRDKMKEFMGVNEDE